MADRKMNAVKSSMKNKTNASSVKLKTNATHSKENKHFIPASKIAKGRRPHSERMATVEPYQPLLLDEADLVPRLKPSLYSAKTTSAKKAEEMEKPMNSSTKSDSKETLASGATENRVTESRSTETKVAGSTKGTGSSAEASSAEASSTKANNTTADSATKEEVIIEGRAAPKQKNTRSEIKERIETLVGAVQLGTSLVKGAFPKPFEVAEKVVEEWKNDGDFADLPISQPLVQFYVGKGLRRVKETEKTLEQKLETAGVLPVVRKQWQKAQKYLK